VNGRACMTTTAKSSAKFSWRQQMRRKKSGQSLVEILPAVVIFVTVMLAGLNYFRVMRTAVIRQEVVRNAVFAAIFNSGSLTTPSALLSNPSGGPGAAGETDGAGHETGGSRIIAGNKFAFVGADVNCFVVFPRNPVKTLSTPLLPSLVQGDQPEVSLVTYAVVHRRWNASSGAGCAP
jgi:hypothetical protein